MGDKNPKAKQREKNQKDASRTQAKGDLAKRQAGFASAGGKDSKKK